MPDEDRGNAAGAEAYRSAERLKFFTDAVVAIAMTLLILPLMEGVSEAARQDLTTREYLSEHSDQLLAFAISFVVIASFWRAHHALFEHVAAYTPLLVWLNIAWMFTVVWLPVPTALVGSLETDRAQLALYIGSMLANAVVTVGLQVAVRHAPAVWEATNPPDQRGMLGALTFAVLLTAALALALAAPDVGYLALLVLLASGPVERVLDRVR